MMKVQTMRIDNSAVNDSIVRSLTLLSESGVADFLDQLCLTNSPTSVGFVNQYAYNLMHSNKQTAQFFHALSYRLRDGAGIKIACQYNQCDPGENLNGTDFIPVLLEKLKNADRKKKTLVFGTEEPWLSKGAKSLLEEQDHETINGFECDAAYVQRAVECSEKSTLLIIILAMGMPKQERISQQLMESLTTPAVIVCGGAIVDFHASRFSRAPSVFRNLGLEWLYRLCVEPKRLFRRYVLGIPEFIFYMVKNKLLSK
jgi:exopolysaccharide biosynthesis WecB/TagA/CpsF family protein